jgi:PAS domain S-box-containing protein
VPELRTGDEIASEIERILACFSSVPVGVACVAVDGRLLAANPSLCQIVGRTEQEMSGTGFLDLTRPDDREGYLDLLGSLLSGKIPSFETRSRSLHGSGSPTWVQTSVSAVTDEHGEPEYLIALVQDMTEGWSTRQQNARLFGFPLALVFIAGLDGYFKRVGAGYERLLGWTEQEMLSRPFFELVHPDDLATLGGAIQEVAAGHGEVINQEIRALGKDGTYRWLMGNYSPVLDEGLIYGMAIDITERKRAEEALRESEQRTRIILDTAHETFVSIDVEGRIIEWNAQAEQVFGWPRQEALNRPLADTVTGALPNRPCRGPRTLPCHRRGTAPWAADRDRGAAPRRI